GQSIPVAQLSALRFTPATNSNDGNAARPTFTFQVKDDGGVANSGVDTDQSPNTMTISVTTVNDAPVGTGTAIAGVEDRVYTLNVGDFGFSDASDSPRTPLL